jgi:tetratricopeptide (TPR) repeat protein
MINGKYVLNLRNVEYALYHCEGEQKFQMIYGVLSHLNAEDEIALITNNFLCELDINTLAIDNYKKVDTSKFDKKPVWEFIGLEDARVVYWDNEICLTGVRRDTKTDGEGRMEISKVDANANEIGRYRIEPPTKTYCEKNWMPIVDMPYHYVKWTTPTEIVKVNIEKGTSETIHLVKQDIKFPRDIRGGSQVIKVGNFYIALTHEVELWNNEKGNKDGQYYHRFIVWDSNWKIVAYSSDFKFLTASIEFSCGLLFDGNSFIIPFGFQDSTSYILKLPAELFESICNIKLGLKYNNEKIATPNKLQEFILNPFFSTNNFKLAEYYFENGHYASALSFYLRCAEFSKDDDEIYESLLLVAKSLDRVGRRMDVCKSLWLNAISFAPQRPEAYLFLSQLCEHQKNYHESYSYAIIGLQNKNNAKKISINVGYESEYQLVFQQAVISWWIGRFQESRELFADLVKHSDKLNDYYKNLIQVNITSLGRGKDPFLKYNKALYPYLKFKFKDADKIEKNFSQSYQDMFVLTMLNGKKNGTYLEIGSADAFYGSNTALLEELGWKGMSLEIQEKEVIEFRKHRKNEVVLCDATKFDYSKLNSHIDYLQIDCDPATTTFKILTLIPFDTCSFGVITFEHDDYADITRSIKDKSRKYLLDKGYLLVASNISPNDTSSYEDWYVNPKHIDKNIIEVMLDDSEKTKNAEKYMFGKE